jgi:amino acid permease
LTGVVLGFILVNFTGFISMFGLNILVEATTHNDIYNLTELLRKIWGSGMAFAYDVVIVLCGLGATLAYLIIEAETIA